MHTKSDSNHGLDLAPSMLKRASLFRSVAIAAIYLLLAKVGLLFAVKQGNITIFWPAGGFALAALLLIGPKQLPAIFTGAYLAGLMVGDSHPVSLAIAAGNTLETFAAWWLLGRLKTFDSRLKSTESFFAIIAVSAFAALLSAYMGVISLWSAGIVDSGALNPSMQRWWMGDVLGIVLITPTILIGHNLKSWRQQAGLLETGLLFVTTGLVGLALFCDQCWLLDYCDTVTVPAWIIPFVVWGGLRCHAKVASILTLLIFILTLWGAHEGVGYFGRALAADQFSEFWVSGMVLSMICMTLSINAEERKLLLERLQLTQFAMDNASVEVYWIDKDGFIDYANKQTSSALGYSSEEIRHISIPKLDPLFSVERWQQHWLELKDKGSLYLETQHRRKDGTIRPIEVFANYLHYGDLEYNVAFASDISQRKAAEEALRASEQRFRDLFYNSPDPCSLIEKTTFTACNEAAARALGYDSSDELIGLHPAQLSPTLQADGRASIEKAEALMAITWQQGTQRFKWLHRHRMGRILTFEITLNKIQIEGKPMLYCIWRDITKAEALAANLEKERQQLYKTEELARVGSWELNHSDNSLIWSDEVFHIFGWAPQSFAPNYQIFLHAVHPDDQEKVDAAYQASLAVGAADYEIEHRILHQKTGETLFVMVRCRRVRNPDGKIISSLGMMQDITEQKRLRRDSERLARSVAASVNEIYIFDAETLRFSFVNQGAQTNLGYSLPELLSMTPLDIKPVFDAETFAKLIKPLRAHEKHAQVFNTLHQAKNGHLYPVEVHLQLFEPEYEQPYFLAIVVDTSEQRQLELQMASLVNAVSAIIWSTDGNGNFTHISPQLTDILGYRPEAMLGKNLHAFLNSNSFHPEDKALQLQALQELLEHDKPVRNLEQRVKDARGNWRWMMVSMTPIRDFNGTLQQIVGVVTDIDTQKQAEHALRNINSELDRRVQLALDEIREKDIMLQQQSRMVAMGEMIGNIAHQWRQPLNTLAIILMDLEDSFVTGHITEDSLKESIKCCNELLDKMSTTIDDFRNFFNKNKTLVREPVCKVIEEVANLMRNALAYHDIELTIDYPVKPVEAMLYPGELSQALLCLINNAKDQLMAADNIRHGKIDIAISDDPDWAIIRVADNAGGVPEELRPKIFDPYFTTKRDSNGLGLYISKLTIEQSIRGRLTVENTGDGACFTIFLPKSSEETHS